MYIDYREQSIPLGSHLVIEDRQFAASHVPELGFIVSTRIEHHGIYVGNNKVVHKPGSRKAKLLGKIFPGNVTIAEEDMSAFLREEEFKHKKQKLKIVFYEKNNDRSGREIARLARNKVDSQEKYHLWNSNCEHFVTEIVYGHRDCRQIPRFFLQTQVEKIAIPVSQGAVVVAKGAGIVVFVVGGVAVGTAAIGGIYWVSSSFILPAIMPALSGLSAEVLGFLGFGGAAGGAKLLEEVSRYTPKAMRYMPKLLNQSEVKTLRRDLVKIADDNEAKLDEFMKQYRDNSKINRHIANLGKSLYVEETYKPDIYIAGYC